MLTLRLKSGEYVAIGEDIAVQVFRRGSGLIEVAVKAPREIPVLRGEILERTEDRPDGLRKSSYKSPSAMAHNQKRQETLERKQRERRSAMESVNVFLDEIESTNPELQSKIQSMRRQLTRMM